MKVLVKRGTNISLHIFEDTQTITIEEEQVVVGAPGSSQGFISHLYIANCILFENVTPPDDWKPSKYLYTESGGWTLNSDWGDSSGEEPSSVDSPE